VSQLALSVAAAAARHPATVSKTTMAVRRAPETATASTGGREALAQVGRSAGVPAAAEAAEQDAAAVELRRVAAQPAGDGGEDVARQGGLGGGRAVPGA
jgi:hypothetical protein